MHSGIRILSKTFAVLGALALVLHVAAAPALALDPVPPVTYELGDLDGQNGWDGGIVSGSPFPMAPGTYVVTDAAAYTGTQSWLYGGGSSSPGAGTPFTPVVATVGALNATAAGSPITPAGNKSVVSFAFKAVVPGDGSRINVYEGSFARDDRTGASLYLENGEGNGNPPGTVSLFNYNSLNDESCNFMQVNMWAVSAGSWHTVEITTVYPNLTVDNPSTYGFSTYVFDKGTVNEATFAMQSWPHAWRHCNGFPYAPGSSLKWASLDNDYPTHSGFYIDDLSMTITNTNTNAVVGQFATSFESTAPPPPAIAFVKTVGTATHGAGFFNSLNVTVPAAGVAAGHSLVVAIYASSATVTFACSDTKGNAYSQNVAAGGGGSARSAIVSAHNVNALVGGDTITCTFPNTSTTSGMSVNEFSGLTATPLDKTASASGSNTTVNSGLTPATTQTNELVFGFVHAPAFTPATTGSNPSEIYASPPNSDPFHVVGQVGPIWPAYRIVSTTRQYQTNGTGGGSGGWRAMTATFKGF